MLYTPKTPHLTSFRASNQFLILSFPLEASWESIINGLVIVWLTNSSHVVLVQRGQLQINRLTTVQFASLCSTVLVSINGLPPSKFAWRLTSRSRCPIRMPPTIWKPCSTSPTLFNYSMSQLQPLTSISHEENLYPLTSRKKACLGKKRHCFCLGKK